jgi:arylsulfatase
MNRNYVWAALILIVLALSGCLKQSTELPNIIIIFTDDQGYADLGCYGATEFKTPNIDRLANEGARFTSFYVSEAVCSASRASLMTGCYAQRVGIRGALSPFTMTGLNPEETTIASMLKNQGYSTCMVGKWHLGNQQEFLPTHYGFDEYLGIPYSNDMWPVGYDGERLEEGYKSIYPELPLIENDSAIAYFRDLDAQDSITNIYTRKAIEFIRQHGDSPFFLYLAHSMVHVPLAVDDRFRGSSEQGMYGDVMQEIDWSVGEIVKTLNDLKLDDNTLIIYTSDNGPWLNFGNHAGSAYPLREGKGNAWEGGVRVPCIMQYPGVIKGGREVSQMASTLDILPTIASITGNPLPEKEIDGKNILPLLKGEVDAQPRNEFLYYYEGGLCAVRKGEWKLVVPHAYRSYKGVEPGKDGLPGPYSRGKAGIELYNLNKDVGELHDVSALYPEIVKELSALADSARQALGDRITGIRGRDNRSPGRIRMNNERIDHKARGLKYTLKYMPSQRYPGGTAYPFTDGYLGSLEFTDESWMGFQGEDVEVFLDLGAETPISSIAISCLQNQASWIFLPQEITILAANDPRYFNAVYHEQIAAKNRDLEILKSTFEFGKELEARYLKIFIRNTGKCPDWHPGRGEHAWLFVDEILIE